MKIRDGFVSNSSSSSYVCASCGMMAEVDSSELSNGYMGSICKKGHYLCWNCSEVGNSNDDQIDLRVEKELYNWEIYKQVDPIHCPICRFEIVSNEDAVKWLLKEKTTSINEIKKMILNSFKSYDEFAKYIADIKDRVWREESEEWR